MSELVVGFLYVCYLMHRGMFVTYHYFDISFEAQMGQVTIKGTPSPFPPTSSSNNSPIIVLLN
jgi:hypothetical protein